jgi:hypothetical protein
MPDRSHADDARIQINMAVDCLKRALDGLESEAWVYVMDQLGKASVRCSEASFRVDTAHVLADRATHLNRGDAEKGCEA